ncbi:MAG: RluA family pseudouridine synthase [Marinagarivorans sp.]|nr:RluA family pseudouridine synthase [Marinagarivorans sp.]
MRIFTYTPPLGLPTVVYEDAHYVVINKPSGLLSNPGRDPLTHDCAITRMQHEYGELYLVHRLDCDTSGLLVMAKTKPAESAFKKALEKRQIKKTYEALVWGEMAKAKGVIDAAIGPNPDDRPLQQVMMNGKEAITEYRVLEFSSIENVTRVELMPQTGRTHQLRVHLNHVGHPILGDSFYAHAQALAAKPRLCLHAQSLHFEHFALGKRLTLQALADF